MPHLPDPNKYNDPIKFFRDSHALITTQINLLEKLAQTAEASGNMKSVREDTRWAELLDFLINSAPRHEMDEELALFPIVLEKIPHVGFQHGETPIRFIHEQHEIIQRRTNDLIIFWKKTLDKPEISDAEAAQFIAGAKELVAIFRDHMRHENELIYTTANDDLLSPVDRQKILEMIRENNSKEVMSDFLEYDQPTYSLTGYKPVIVTGNSEDAVSDATVDGDGEDEGEEEE